MVLHRWWDNPQERATQVLGCPRQSGSAPLSNQREKLLMLLSRPSAPSNRRHGLMVAQMVAILRVRMALHTGEAVERDNDYFGQALEEGLLERVRAQWGEDES
jgi:hypothetical protein